MRRKWHLQNTRNLTRHCICLGITHQGWDFNPALFSLMFITSFQKGPSRCIQSKA